MVTKQKYDLRGKAGDPNTWITIPEFNVFPADVGCRGFDRNIFAPEIDRSIQGPIWNIIWFMRDKAKRRFASLADLMAAFDRVFPGGKKLKAATEDEWFAYGYVCVFEILERWHHTHPFNKLEGSVLLAQLAEEVLNMYSSGPHDPKSIGDIRSAFARKGATTKLANSTKQREKEQVKQCWDRWQERPTDYKGKAAFARGMLEKYENLESQRVIERWCLDWQREANGY